MSGQAETQLRKLEAERDRLQAELKSLQEAISTKEACEECVDPCPALCRAGRPRARPNGLARRRQHPGRLRRLPAPPLLLPAAA